MKEGLKECESLSGKAGKPGNGWKNGKGGTRASSVNSCELEKTSEGGRRK